MPDPNDLHARLGAMVREKMLAPDKGYIFIHPMESVAIDLLQRLAEQEAPCTWTDDSDGLWTSACGLVDWAFNDGGPVENRVKFCLGCGHPVVISAALSATPPPPETEVK